MRLSRASLRLEARGTATSATRAFAGAPQRWNLGGTSGGGWFDAVHQLVGDGLFDGDVALTRVSVLPGARAVVRGISATPLRPGRSVAAATVNVRDGALLWLPGAIVPHAGSCHGASVDVRASQGSEVLVASALVGGRTAWGETGAFHAVRLRTCVRYGGTMAFAEDVLVKPGDLVAPTGFGAFEAYVSLLALGPSLGRAFADVSCLVNGVAGTSELRAGGVAVRALFPHLGAAREFVEGVELRAKEALAPCPGGAC